MNRNIRFSLLLPLLALALTSPAWLSAQPTVTVSTVTAPVQTLSINDVDFLNSTTPKWIFSIIMSSSSPDPVEVRMELRLSVSLATGDQFDNLVFLRSEPFVVTGTRTITNLDLRNEALVGEYITDDGAMSKLREVALSTGIVPAGEYRFAVAVYVGDVVQTGDFSLILTNPSSVELIAPADGDGFVGRFPLFQWQGDAPSWKVSIYEQLPGQGSREEAVSGIPHLIATVTSQTFQYPTSGVRALEENHTYVWFVEGVFGVAGGTSQGFKSPLRSFTVAPSGSGESFSSLLDELERALGPQYQTVIDDIRQQGLTSSGIMRLNGSPITAAELTNILNMLRSNPDAVSSAVLE